MLIHNFLENAARRFPDKVALITGTKRATYAQLNQSANNLAQWFITSGVQQGDRALFLLENGEDYVISYYAALKAGLVVVPLSAETRSDTLIHILHAVSPTIIIASQRAEKTIYDISAPPASLQMVLFTKTKLAWQQRCYMIFSLGDHITGQSECPVQSLEDLSLASILFTSGSTGKPKGVMLSHANIVANTTSIIQYLRLSEQDRQMVILPFHYVMGKSLLNTHIAVGGSLVINNSFAYPAAILQQMADEEVTGFSGVPATYAYLLHRSPLKTYRDKLPTLQYCAQAGGHMPRQIKEELIAALPDHTRLYIMYGATEASARLTYVEPERLLEKIDSIGIPIPGVKIHIQNETGQECTVGETGELIASGPNIMLGYWNDLQGTSAALSPDGYCTGDLGYRDRDGYFYLTGRKDNQLKVGGHRINPQEIEDALIATGMLLEVVVVGIPDPLTGHKLIAFAVPIDKNTIENEILAKLIGLLPRYKLPGAIKFVKALPKNSHGKIDRDGCVLLTH
jgi:acyl-CoA synthetase (AMP-forming)/AMP-acid ligase II